MLETAYFNTPNIPFEMRYPQALRMALKLSLPCKIHTRSLSASVIPEKFTLRPYQEAAIASVMDALNRPKHPKSRLGVSSPTGSGKTRMFVELARRLSESKPGKVLVIVNGIELASQAYDAFVSGWPSASVEMDQSASVATGDADVTIATFQTLIRPGRMSKYDPADFKLLLVDEAHHAAARSYVDILAHFDPSIHGEQDSVTGSKVPIVGFSATFSRHDSLALGKVFEEIVFHKVSVFFFFWSI